VLQWDRVSDYHRGRLAPRGFDISFSFNTGGERGIRTPDTRKGIHAFEARAFSHSAISPHPLVSFSFYQGSFCLRISQPVFTELSPLNLPIQAQDAVCDLVHLRHYLNKHGPRSFSEDSLDLLQMIKVVPGEHAHDVFDRFLAALRVHAVVLPLLLSQ
jgi:hypothetical protein